jgi:CheY-like chemotaxis protein
MAGALKGLSVLLADDEADIVELLEAVLTEEGATVKTASNAREALHVLEGWRPDVMLLDINMPMMSGYDLLSALRQDPALRQIPAVAVTGNPQANRNERAFETGFAVHVTKPFDTDALVELVGWLSRRRGKSDPPPPSMSTAGRR